jgi:hypothetical protein
MPRENIIAQKLAEGVWYAEGAAYQVAADVLRQPRRFDALFECLLSDDVGTAKRAAMALEAVSEKRADLFAPYIDILLHELEIHSHWHVRFRLCPIVPRLKLSPAEFDRAVELFRELSSHPQNALVVNALSALSALALRNDELREEMIWLMEQKMHHASKAMQSRCRQVLPQLYAGAVTD